MEEKEGMKRSETHILRDARENSSREDSRRIQLGTDLGGKVLPLHVSFKVSVGVFRSQRDRGRKSQLARAKRRRNDTMKGTHERSSTKHRSFFELDDVRSRDDFRSTTAGDEIFGGNKEGGGDEGEGREESHRD